MEQSKRKRKGKRLMKNLRPLHIFHQRSYKLPPTLASKLLHMLLLDFLLLNLPNL
jgi:hypothetical protein